MIKVLFALVISSVSFAQLQSLAEYNRFLNGRISENKPLTAREFKTLRIRLGTEITSADDVVYKEGELLKLLEYSIVIAEMSKDRSEENVVKDLWSKYLALPNFTAQYFEINNVLGEHFGRKTNPFMDLDRVNYVTKIIPPGKETFFFPVIRYKCQILTALRKDRELEACWANEEKHFPTYQKSEVEGQVFALRKLKKTAAQIRAQMEAEKEREKEKPVADFKYKLDLEVRKLLYYGRSYTRQARFQELADHIYKTESLAEVKPLAKRIRILNALSAGYTDKLDDYIKALAKDKSDDTQNIDDILMVLIYTAQNKMNDALKAFKMIREGALERDRLELFYKSSFSFFYQFNDLRKAEFYLDKLIEMYTVTAAHEVDTFEVPNLFIQKIALNMLLKKTTNPAEFTSKLNEVKTLRTQFQVDDVEVLNEERLAEYLVTNPTLDLKQFSALVDEYKKLHFAHIPATMMLERLVVEMSNKANEIEVPVKKAPAANANQPAAPGTAGHQAAPAKTPNPAVGVPQQKPAPAPAQQPVKK